MVRNDVHYSNEREFDPASTLCNVRTIGIFSAETLSFHLGPVAYRLNNALLDIQFSPEKLESRIHLAHSWHMLSSDIRRKLST